MTIFKLFLFTILALVSTLGSKIILISPKQLSDQFEDDIEFAVSHFGTIPYGAHFVGKVFLIDTNNNACDTVEPFSHGENTADENVIAIVRRGGCRISIKTRNAQFAGAKALIIVSDGDGELSEWFGHEQGADDIKIPTLMIKASDGNKIIQYLEQVNSGVLNNQDSEQQTGVILSISFPYDPKSSVVRLDYWYSAADNYKSSFLFLKRFYEHWSRNKDSILLVPHMVTWTCAECKKGGFKTDSDPDCLSGGRYCAPDPDEGGAGTGADVVREDLRQSCIYEIAKETKSDLWWKYVLAFGEKCLDQSNINTCGRTVFASQASPSDLTGVDLCMSQSYESSNNQPHNDKLNDNSILREEKELQLEYSIHQFPALFINHKPYYGKLHHAFLIFEEACRNLEVLPNDCKVALMRTGESGPSSIPQSHTGRVLVIITLMTILAVVVFFCCRRLMRTESRGMSVEVGGLVTKYFALRDNAEESKEDTQ